MKNPATKNKLSAAQPMVSPSFTCSGWLRGVSLILFSIGFPFTPVCCDPSPAFAYTASWYSTASSKKEGTSGIWKVTAYCGCKICCGKTDGITASGRKETANHTVACNWLLFGTRIKIDDRIYTVEDRGAKSLFGTKSNPIKHIDIFFNTHQEARKFGVKYLPVEILK